MCAVILTRPRHQAEAFAQALQSRGLADVAIHPLIRIKGTQVDVPDGRDGLIFTSANAIPFTQVRSHVDMTVICVGDTTALAAKSAGYSPLSVNGTAEDLAAFILDDARYRKLRWFHSHGAHVAGHLAARLRAEGVDLVTRVSYEQQVLDWDIQTRDVVSRKSNLFPVFSPNGATVLMNALGHAATQHRYVAISRAAADRLRAVPVHQIHLAEAPTREAMLNSVIQAVDFGESF